MTPKVSVIVPVYKAEATIRRCVDSILGQTLKDLELLLIDDGSPDGSGAICDEYAAKDRRVRVFHKANGGVSSARNLGLDNARGEWISFVDSDDRISPDMLEILTSYQNRDNADCVVCGLTQDTGSIWAPETYRKYESISDFKDDLPYQINTELISSPVNKLYKMELISIKFEEGISFGEDLMFCIDYLANCRRITFITEAPYLHNNINEGSLVHTYNPQRFGNIEAFSKRIHEFYGDRHDPRIDAKYVRDIADHLFSLLQQPDIADTAKRAEIAQWYAGSHLKRIKRLPISRIHWKKRLMLRMLCLGRIDLFQILLKLSNLQKITWKSL